MQVHREAWDELISPTMTNNSPKSDSKSNKKSDEVGRVDTGMGESDIGMGLFTNVEVAILQIREKGIIHTNHTKL